MGGEGEGEIDESNLRRVGRWRNGSRGEVGGGGGGDEEAMGSIISSSTLRREEGREKGRIQRVSRNLRKKGKEREVFLSTHFAIVSSSLFELVASNVVHLLISFTLSASAVTVILCLGSTSKTCLRRSEASSLRGKVARKAFGLRRNDRKDSSSSEASLHLHEKITR